MMRLPAVRYASFLLLPAVSVVVLFILFSGEPSGGGASESRLPDTPAVRILAVQVAGDRYAVYFDENVFDHEDFELTDPPPEVGDHVHFFFDTVPVTEAGLPGAGPWYGYVGISPLTHYFLTDRPPGATSICALIANDDHSVRPGTGNCVPLPK